MNVAGGAGMRGIFLTEDPVYAAPPPGPPPQGEFGLAQELAHDIDHVGLILPQRIAQVCIKGLGNVLAWRRTFCMTLLAFSLPKARVHGCAPSARRCMGTWSDSRSASIPYPATPHLHSLRNWTQGLGCVGGAAG